TRRNMAVQSHSHASRRSVRRPWLCKATTRPPATPRIHLSATSEERRDEVEEVLRVRAPVVVEVGVAVEEIGEEVEEVLGVDRAVVVPVGGAAGDGDAVDGYRVGVAGQPGLEEFDGGVAGRGQG